MAKDRFGFGTEIPRSSDRDIPGLLRSGYEEERKHGDPWRKGWYGDEIPVEAPDIRFENGKYIVKLNRDNAREHVNFIENLFSGSQNVSNMIYEIDGKQYDTKFSFFRGARLEEIDGDDYIGLQ
jgi:hypothetical protein